MEVKMIAVVLIVVGALTLAVIAGAVLHPQH